MTITSKYWHISSFFQELFNVVTKCKYIAVSYRYDLNFKFIPTDGERDTPFLLLFDRHITE